MRKIRPSTPPPRNLEGFRHASEKASKRREAGISPAGNLYTLGCSVYVDSFSTRYKPKTWLHTVGKKLFKNNISTNVLFRLKTITPHLKHDHTKGYPGEGPPPTPPTLPTREARFRIKQKTTYPPVEEAEKTTPTEEHVVEEVEHSTHSHITNKKTKRHATRRRGVHPNSTATTRGRGNCQHHNHNKPRRG